MKRHRTMGFTIIELLVVVSIIALLVGILLPAIGKARDQARLSISLANLRNLGTAHASYGAEWNDRQYTAVNDNIAAYWVPDQPFATGDERRYRYRLTTFDSRLDAQTQPIR